jgi:hypothetical protein
VDIARLVVGLGCIALAACSGEESDADADAAPVASAEEAATTTTNATTLPTTSTSTTLAPLVSVPVDWTTITSSRFEYSLQHPPDWITIPATQDWPGTGFPNPFGKGVDRVAPSAESALFVFIASTTAEFGEMAKVQLDQETPLVCTLSDRHQIVVDGAEARQEDQFCFSRDYLIEVLVSNGERFYQIDMLSKAPFTADERLLFDQLLASFKFDA